MGREPVVDVVEAVAETKGIDTQELEYPLERYIDTEALRMLAAHQSSSWTLSFDLPEHEVTVTGDGEVWVEERSKKIHS